MGGVSECVLIFVNLFRDEHTRQSRFACEEVPNPALQRAYMAIEVNGMADLWEKSLIIDIQ